MFFSRAVAWFIIITAATVPHTAHVTTINTAADAARALEPLVRTFPHSGEVDVTLYRIYPLESDFHWLSRLGR